MLSFRLLPPPLPLPSIHSIVYHVSSFGLRREEDKRERRREGSVNKQKGKHRKRKKGSSSKADISAPHSLGTLRARGGKGFIKCPSPPFSPVRIERQAPFTTISPSLPTPLLLCLSSLYDVLYKCTTSQKCVRKRARNFFSSWMNPEYSFALYSRKSVPTKVQNSVTVCA